MSDQADEEEQEKHFFTFADPALRRHSPHALTQLRLARTHDRIEIEIEIDFPVRGVSLKGILTPPNLRYIYNIYNFTSIPLRGCCIALHGANSAQSLKSLIKLPTMRLTLTKYSNERDMHLFRRN